MEWRDERTHEEAETHHSRKHDFLRKSAPGRAGDLFAASLLQKLRPRWNDAEAAWRAGDFYKPLPPGAISEFKSLAAPSRCEGGTVLLSEGEQPSAVLFLLEGKVKLSMNSNQGRRLILGIAEPGDILELAAAFSDCPYEVTAEAQSQCKITALARRSFLDFIVRYPVAAHNVARLLFLEHKRACGQLRNLGLTLSASARLARLLLEWCADGRRTEHGIRIQHSFTHEEIGECIGVARETVSRTLADLKHRELVEQRGSSLFVSNLRGLEIYAERIDH